MIRAGWLRGLVLSTCGAVFGLCGHQGEAFGQTVTYGYDALGRLVSVGRTDGTSASYAYDPAGNRTLVSTNVPVVPPPLVTPAAFDLGGPVSGTSGVWVTSNAPTITGINVPVPVSVSGGNYRIDGGAWQSAAGTISAGQTVQVQVLTPASGGSSQTATLSVGGVSDTFQVTAAVDIDPDPTTFQALTISSNDPSISGVGSESLITGINQPVVLRIQRFYYSGSLDSGDIDYQVFNASNVLVDGGSFDIRGADPGDDRYREVTVENGYRLKYSVRASTTTGRRNATWSMAVWRMAGNASLLSLKDVSVTVDADNNYQVPANALFPGEMLFPGQALMSSDGQSRLEFRGDGSLIITCNGVNQQTLYSGGNGAYMLWMQPQGNLVLYGSSGALWYTSGGGYPSSYLVLQDDGNLVIYYGGSTPIWYSSTFC